MQRGDPWQGPYTQICRRHEVEIQGETAVTVWFISEPRSNSPPWDCQQCGRSAVISPRVAVGSAVPRLPLVSSLLVTVTDILGREGPLQSEGTLQATVPLWSRKQTGMTPGSA